ncbi:MAG: hypothetical protein K2N15_10880 [Lachnospiraceae bacterium]|nr:hypothetical protein [Lachnospiraceae bacterium]
MKKKTIIISGIAGAFILGLCVKFIVNSRDVPVIENAAVEENVVSDEANEWIGQETTESKLPGEVQPKSEKSKGMESEEAQQEPEGQDKIAIPEEIHFIKPVVQLDGEEGELMYNWNSKSIRVDDDTLLLVSDCYFPEEKLQQKIFFLAEAPYFIPQEVFRQDSKIWDEESRPSYNLEKRMEFPHPVDGGYVYELDGVLYFLTKDFQEATLLYDLHQLMGDLYSFSLGTFRTCDVTEDASRMLVCTDEGLYEYDLENGNRKLLESAYYAPHEINENDCLCGQRDFRFAGPVKVEYGPDEQSYAYLMGTEEADWGDITGVALRSGEGETLYQKESDNVYDFKWVESEDAAYLAVFYTELDEKGIVNAVWLMDRVDMNTGEVVTFEAPKEIYWGGRMCCVVGFLDEDTLLYMNFDKQDDDKGEEKNDKDIFEVYRLSSGERQDLEVVGDADWKIMILDEDGYETIPVRYPK